MERSLSLFLSEKVGDVSRRVSVGALGFVRQLSIDGAEAAK